MFQLKNFLFENLANIFNNNYFNNYNYYENKNK